MKSTRSGRTIKKSCKYLDEEQEFYDEVDIKGEDVDYSADDTTEDESIEDDIEFKKEFSSKQRSKKRRKNSGSNKSFQEISNLTSICKTYIKPDDMEGSVDTTSSKSGVNNTIPNPLDFLQKQIAMKMDVAVKFYVSISRFLEAPNYTYPEMNLNSGIIENQSNLKTIELIKKDRHLLKLDMNLFDFSYNTEKANEKIKEIIGVSLEIKELEKYSRINSYFLYNLVCKRRAETSGQHSAQSAKDFAKNWAKMPERTRRDWEIKSSKVKRQIEDNRKRQIIEESSKREKRKIILKKAEETLEKITLKDFNLVDLSGYLKASSDGLSKLSTQLKDVEGCVATSEVKTILLDYLLISCVSLAGIFEIEEGLDRSVTTDSLNKVTLILPGSN